ncbi:hypothetical protein F5Y09DRAFT_259841 [Xylaria sp. FL1042]|nr:hypothetical protein F5Y09DRAFT_259841 [Xylaria sp. FL1042]
MSMAKDTAAHDDLPSHKRQTSLSGFFSKLLPSHRAEQGGTARSRDITNDSDSAYTDLGMNPNDLTEWNLAQERPLRPPPSEGRPRSQHHRGNSWSIQRGRPRLRVDVGRSSQIPRRTPSADLGRVSKPLEPPAGVPSQTHHGQSQPITRDEIRDVLKTKEDTRKHRRSLKESGDWLGVQGADPYSGEFAVLTPTSTMSSETTPISTKVRLAELSWRQRAAKLAYEQARLEEVTERERILLQKGQSKLEKMEHAKEELRHSQRDYPTWSQHKRRWSSAAEPDLSPIPQSTKSGNAGGSSNDAAASGSIRNFSRPSKSNGGPTTDKPKPIEPSGNSENTERSKPDRGDDRSTDTIVHKLPNMKLQDRTIKTKTVAYPTVLSDTSDSPPQEQKDEKSFLWRRRRRMSDPGNSGKHPSLPAIRFSAGKTKDSLGSASVAEPPPPLPRLYPRQEVKDHFPDLSIPDPYLHLVPYSGPMEKMEKLPTTTKRDPFPTKPVGSAQSSHSEAQSKTALSIATNLSDCRNSQNDPPGIISDAKRATVISSQSKPKGNTKPPPLYRRLIPLRSSSCQVKIIRAQESSQIQTQSISQAPIHVDTGLPKNMVGSQGGQHQSNSRTISTAKILDDHIATNLNERHGNDQGESASTPTIIITGFDRDHNHDPQLLLEGIQSPMEDLRDEKSNAAGNHESPVTSSFHSDEQGPHGESTPEKEWSTTTSSRPTTPQKDSQSFVLARETPETDTVSTDLAISGADPTIPGQYLQAHWSYQNPKSVPANCAWGILEEFGNIKQQPQPQQQRVANEGQNMPAKEFKTSEADPPPHPQRNKAQPARQCQTPSEHRETMIQEAARVAMRKSQAKEIVTTRSRTPSRTPSPRTRDTRSAIPSRQSAKNPMENGHGSRSGADDMNTGFPLANADSTVLQPQPQSSQLRTGVQHRSLELPSGMSTEKWNTGEDRRKTKHGRSDNNTKAGVIVILVSLLITIYMVLFGLAYTWWVMVYPAFDQRSSLWRRWRRRENSLHDFGILAAAALFCGTSALVSVSAVRMGFWLVRIGVWVLFQL